MDPVWLIPAWIGSAIWLWIAWRIHLAQGVAGPLRKVDLAIRWLAAGSLGVAGAMGLTGALGQAWQTAQRLGRRAASP